jgi:transcriptional regulator with XRE-family HTH domain
VPTDPPSTPGRLSGRGAAPVKLVSDTFGRRLKAIRRARGLTQAELAALVGKSKQSISAWEHGHGGVRLIDAEIIAIALGCRLKHLLATVDAPVPRAPMSWLQERLHLRRQIAAGGAATRGGPA